ncbi:hypothetical protein [Helicobacter sp. T3_23-1056]
MSRHTQRTLHTQFTLRKKHAPFCQKHKSTKSKNLKWQNLAND